MKNESQEPLEQFIDDALKRLPNLKAPPQLVSKVMSQVELQPVAWWQSGWVCWPLAVQIMAVLTIGALAVVCVQGLINVWSTEGASLLLAQGVELFRDASDVMRVVGAITRPFKTHLMLHLTVLCLVAPLVIGGIRTLWLLTLNKETTCES